MRESMVERYKKLLSLALTLCLVIGLFATGLFQTEVQAAEVGDVSITSVATGKHHTLALDSTGHVWSWGQNYFGQLGLGYSSSSEGKDVVTTPRLVPGLSNVVKIAASYNSHSLALTEDGKLYGWGYNYYGQLGLGTKGSTARISSPTLIPTSSFDAPIAEISAGYNFTMVLTENGTLYTFGINTYGELGNNSTSYTGVPQRISLSEKVVAIEAGWESAMILTESGKVYVCGYGGYGEMGNGKYTVYNKTFIQVTGVYNANDPVVQISNEGYHMLALTKNGTLWSWGKGDRGELGNGARTHKNTPQNITSLIPLKSGETIAQIDCGYEDMAIVTNTGRFLATGTSMYGALGIGGKFSTTGQQTTLMQIDSAPDVTVEIRTGGDGYYKRFIIGDDGTLYVTGNNYYGSIGASNIEYGLYKGTTVYTAINFPFENTYVTVNYDKNSPDATGTMDKQVVLKGEAVTLLDNTFENVGYLFAGWSTTPNGGVEYQNGASVKFTKDTTLYAVWQIDPSQFASVIYDANGGSGSDTDNAMPGAYKVKSVDATGIVAPAGYTFASWNTASNGSGQQYDAGDIITLAPSQNVTLYAIWDYTGSDVYTVTYDANGGQGGSEEIGLALNTNHTVRGADDANVSRTGWTFLGWNTEADGSGTAYQANDNLVVTEDIILYAQWEYSGAYCDVFYYSPTGIGGGSDGVYPMGDLYTIKHADDVGISADNREFLYWYDLFTGTNYYAGEQITLTGDLYLVPQFGI